MDVVKELIIFGVDVNLYSGDIILFLIVCENEYLEIVVVLIKVGVDVNLNV